MPAETTTYDDAARRLYELHRERWPGERREGWRDFDQLTRKERDYWRALIAVDGGYLNG